MSRKTDAARPCGKWWHPVSKFRRAISMEISVEDRKANSTGAEFRRLKTVSKWSGTDDKKGLAYILSRTSSQLTDQRCFVWKKGTAVCYRKIKDVYVELVSRGTEFLRR